ncbi:MAG TPA: DUF4189 domain-containing protein [Methylomirabilota bacterium]|nr:DUF4189 domain-containing protein [Methylomirabilota bacterium]
MAQRAGLFMLATLVSGCASTGRLGGVAGPVQWEIIDVGRVESADGRRLRWSYTVVLKETAGTPIQFERIERGTHGSNVETGGNARTDFERRLEAHAELRYPATDNWGFMAWVNPQFGGTSVLPSLALERRFIGTDSRGQTVVVPVRVVLDRSFGRASRQPSKIQQPDPPARSLQAQDLPTLAGRWEGYYRIAEFAIPVEAVIHGDGSVEFGENDPVTNRFRGTIGIREGGLWYAGRDAAGLTYHEGAGRQLLVGHLRPQRGDAIPVRLERIGSLTVSSIESLPSKPGLSRATELAFETYKSDAKHRHFKAFAVDRVSGKWGLAWSHPSAAAAMERALYECRKTSAGCEVYAVGDAVLDSVSPEQRAAIVLGGTPLTYNGVLKTDQGERTETSPASFYLFRGVSEMTGSWTTDEPGIAGVITGGVSDTYRGWRSG